MSSLRTERKWTGGISEVEECGESVVVYGGAVCLEITLSSVVSRKSGFAIASGSAEGHLQYRWQTLEKRGGLVWWW